MIDSLPIDSLSLTQASPGRRHTSVRAGLQDGLKELTELGLLVFTVDTYGLGLWANLKGDTEAQETLYVDTTGRRAVLVRLSATAGLSLILRGRHQGDREAMAQAIKSA